MNYLWKIVFYIGGPQNMPQPNALLRRNLSICSANIPQTCTPASAFLLTSTPDSPWSAGRPQWGSSSWHKHHPPAHHHSPRWMPSKTPPSKTKSISSSAWLWGGGHQWLLRSGLGITFDRPSSWLPASWALAVPSAWGLCEVTGCEKPGPHWEALENEVPHGNRGGDMFLEVLAPDRDREHSQGGKEDSIWQQWRCCKAR